MGTRGFVGFVVDGVEKIAYNHFDAYPEGVGKDVLDWLRTVDVDEVIEQVRQLRVVSTDSIPTAEDVEELKRFHNGSVGERSDWTSWYQLLRETQGNAAAILDAGVLEDSKEFANDSLMCEWGWLVDLDAKTFEAYRGFQTSRHDKGRFAGRLVSGGSEGYYEVALAGSWPLDSLPNTEEFLALDRDEDDV